MCDVLCRPDIVGVGDVVEVIGDDVDVDAVFFFIFLDRQRLCDHFDSKNVVANLKQKKVSDFLQNEKYIWRNA